MNPVTGEIIGPEVMTEKQREQLEQQMKDLTHKIGKRSLVPIPPDELDKVQAMNLKERRKWAVGEKKRRRQAQKAARRKNR